MNFDPQMQVAEVYRHSAADVFIKVVLLLAVSAVGAQAAQTELLAPWRGSAIIGQGNHGPVSHNVCGQRTLDPNNCAWENTYAIDIDIPYGSDVLAAADGNVTYASDNISPSGGRQMAVTSTSSDGTQTTHVYMHLSVISVYSGHVNQGQVIAKSGASSDGSEYGTSAHLHFHVWAGFGSHDSHTIPIENLLLKRSGADSTFRRYNETNGDLEHYVIAGATFESNNGTASGSPSSGGSSGAFAVGSRVAAAVSAPDGNPNIAVGDQGTVTCLFPAGTNYDLMVDWDKNVNGSSGIGSCTGTTRAGHGWAVKDAWVVAATGTTPPTTSAAPRIDYFNPSSVFLNSATWITVNGANFQNGFSATVQGYAIASPGLRYISADQVSVQVTMGGTTGYAANMVIRNPDGQTASGNFQVTANSPSSGGGSGAFAVGSRVAAAVSAPDGNPNIAVGDQGTATCLFPAGTNYDLMVDWDKNVNGSSGIGSCTGTTRAGHGWAVKDAWVVAATGTTPPTTSAAPRIDYFNPSSVFLNSATWITVNGANFQNGFSATVQGYAIASPGLRYISADQVSVQVTMGGTTGYAANMVIRNPDGQTASGNFQVTANSPSSGGGSGAFAVGSRVAAAVSAPDGNPNIAVGDQGTVTCLFPAGTNYDLMVDWDKNVNGSSGIGSCTGTTRAGHGWAVKDAWVR